MIEYKDIAYREFIYTDTSTGAWCIIDGNSLYYKVNDKWHREDGPARIHGSSAMEWFRHGKLHREDGPATVYAHGGEEWWLNGRRCYNAKTFQEATGISDEDMTVLLLKYKAF